MLQALAIVKYGGQYVILLYHTNQQLTFTAGFFILQKNVVHYT